MPRRGGGAEEECQTGPELKEDVDQTLCPEVRQAPPTPQEARPPRGPAGGPGQKALLLLHTEPACEVGDRGQAGRGPRSCEETLSTLWRRLENRSRKCQGFARAFEAGRAPCSMAVSGTCHNVRGMGAVLRTGTQPGQVVPQKVDCAASRGWELSAPFGVRGEGAPQVCHAGGRAGGCG